MDKFDNINNVICLNCGQYQNSKNIKECEFCNSNALDVNQESETEEKEIEE